AAGMDDYLSKPFSREQLASTLRRWLAADSNAAVAAGPVAPTPLARPTVIERAALDGIRALQREGAPSIVARVVELYLADSARLLATLRQAAEAADAEGLRRAAHTLKSSSANVGALQLAAHCGTLEAAARQGTLAAANDQILRIESELRAVCEELAHEAA